MEATLQVFDVKEREVGEVTPPSFPTPTPSANGFPAHKKRASAFKQRRQAHSQNAPSIPRKAPLSKEEAEAAERRRIAEENQATLDSMSPEEIEEAQRDLFRGLNPSLIERLLRRATLDEPQNGPSPFGIHVADESPAGAKNATPVSPPEIKIEDNSKAKSEKEFIPAPRKEPKKPKKTVTFDDDDAFPVHPPSGLFYTTSADPSASEPGPNEPVLGRAADTTHFPHAPSLPDLDPADPDFLENMHKKFFPSLPADPSKLAWMAPLPTPNSTADRESPYYPGQDSLPVSSLRFDFRGVLLPPRTSRDIPSTLGLHHHGEAPEAAGYTIPELARLARSAVPGQRCIAYQTLGRMLYRLGKGEWGTGVGGRHGEEDDMAFGLWRCFREGKVLESMEEEVSQDEGRGHRSAKAYAMEALWLFEKGGWREKWRGL
ncbi:RPAP1-like protein [Lasiosphaeris hirsuta]|uniref:RPAP1-like protein n=1 Tax=Lasiosphaeris hirsuta TaxID=260670 RepID=A0AA40B0I8_9PEZI|nr:RPAP1-like protein [Lasiosphaeris hirsuta]